jgi:hypothetical protein
VHSWFSVSFPRTEEVYVWDWERPEGWRFWPEETERRTVPQQSGSKAVMAIKVRDRCRPVSSIDEFLVIYSETAHRCSVGLVAVSRPPDNFRSCGVVPPAWWFDEDASPMEVLLAQVQAKIEGLRAEMVRQGKFFVRPDDRSTTAHCGKCGLPYLKHVKHEPDMKRPDSRDPHADWDPYYQAFKEHYQNALKMLSDEEVLSMVLPWSVRYLKVLAVEVQRRIDHPTPMKGRYDRLLEEADIFDP